MKKRQKGLVVFSLFMIIFATSVFSLDNQVFRSTKIWTNEPVGEHVFFVSSIDIAITQINFGTINELNDAKLIIEAQKTNPLSLPKIDNAYQYLTPGKFGISDDSIRDIILQFRIDKSLASNNSNKTEVMLYYFDYSWKPVKTNYIFDDQSFYYYQANPQKLTYFAITIKNKESVITNQVSLLQNTTIQKILNNTIKDNKLNDTLSLDFYGLSKTFFSSKKNTYLFIGGLSGIVIFLVIFITFMKLVVKGEYLDNIEDIQKIIDEELSEGIPKKDIEKEIVKSGWPKRVVDKIVHNERLPHELEVRLKAYIQSMREKTISLDQIRESLLKEGWPKETIDDLTKELTAS